MSNETRGQLLDAVSRAVAEFQHGTDLVDEAVAAQLGVNRTDLRCLGVLRSPGALTARPPGQASPLSPAATTTAVDRLERAGYVQRLRDQPDRRSVRVALTAQAQTRLGELYGPIGT